MTWSLDHKSVKQSDQHQSFIGGVPRLPLGMKVPVCRLCGSLQTFYFQIALPEDMMWEVYTLAVFQCTGCADENHLIPEMLNYRLGKADIGSNFLKHYQINFSFIVFQTNKGLFLNDYKELIQFFEIQIVKSDIAGSFGKLGGVPDWVLEDESPSTYRGSIQMKFLLEIIPNFQFKISHNTKPQIELNIMGKPVPSPLNYYQLFIGNALYLFGTSSGDQLVYAITQI